MIKLIKCFIFGQRVSATDINKNVLQQTPNFTTIEPDERLEYNQWQQYLRDNRDV